MSESAFAGKAEVGFWERQVGFWTHNRRLPPLLKSCTGLMARQGEI